MRSPVHRLLCRVATAAAVLLLATGCSLERYAWRPAGVVAPADPSAVAALGNGLPLAEWHYSQAFSLDLAGREACVDHYFQAAAHAWTADDVNAELSSSSSRSWQLYHSAVTQTLSAAQRYGRWKQGVGLLVQGPTGLTPIPTVFNGFAWNPCDFEELMPVGNYEVPNLSYQFRSTGLGVPLVVVRRRAYVEPFMQSVQSFAATALLRPPATCCEDNSTCLAQRPALVLELFNPLLTDSVPTTSGSAPLARDLSAPFAYPPRGIDRAWLLDYLLPSSATRNDGLFMIEPYQPGKVPLVLIHGLLSDPLTWTNMVNQLRANRELTEHYQIWGFRYSTGTNFFQSAALLRRQLVEIRQSYDPHRTDPAMSRMVLVGHSMGGLLAKLQVVYSGDQMWQTFANRPPSQIVASPQVRESLVEQLFFDPNPDIARVVFIGTPHQGSQDATRCIGRIGAALVETSPETEQQYAQLVRNNPGVLNPQLERRIPRSIDLLEPENPLLLTTLRLPFRAGVQTHTIYGDIDRPLSTEPSDGVVSITSARLVGVCSEVAVPAKHTELTRDPATIAEVARILCQHLR